LSGATISPNVVRSTLPDSFTAKSVDDGARMDRLDLRLEDIYSFEKERPLFEENQEALVCRNYQLVRFNLRKSGLRQSQA
jgi:hypothetical protein